MELGIPPVEDMGRAADFTSQQLAGFPFFATSCCQKGHWCQALWEKLPLTLHFFWDLERRRKMVKAASPSPTPGFSLSFPVWTFMAQSRAKHRARFDRGQGHPRMPFPSLPPHRSKRKPYIPISLLW